MLISMHKNSNMVSNFFPHRKSSRSDVIRRHSLIAGHDLVWPRHRNWFVSGHPNWSFARQNNLFRNPREKFKRYKAVIHPLQFRCAWIKKAKTWLWLKCSRREGKSNASIPQMMKPPYNALQDVKVLCVKFMSAWPPLAEMMGLFTAMPSVCC